MAGLVPCLLLFTGADGLLQPVDERKRKLSEERKTTWDGAVFPAVPVGERQMPPLTKPPTSGLTAGVWSLGRVRPFATPWTAARQAPLSMGFSRQGCGRGLPFPPPGDLPDAGTEPASLASPALPGRLLATEPPGSLDVLTGTMEARGKRSSLNALLQGQGVGFLCRGEAAR